jgi:cellulose synthase/poly-beta-1,6-N-acetylglucosamine synthase-like glycosyltransferase
MPGEDWRRWARIVFVSFLMKFSFLYRKTAVHFPSLNSINEQRSKILGNNTAAIFIWA